MPITIATVISRVNVLEMFVFKLMKDHRYQVRIMLHPSQNVAYNNLKARKMFPSSNEGKRIYDHQASPALNTEMN